MKSCLIGYFCVVSCPNNRYGTTETTQLLLDKKSTISTIYLVTQSGQIIVRCQKIVIVHQIIIFEKQLTTW